jgi:hypothetical protein
MQQNDMSKSDKNTTQKGANNLPDKNSQLGKFLKTVLSDPPAEQLFPADRSSDLFNKITETTQLAKQQGHKI